MPYNTRRISLSLPSLGVHLPGSGTSRSHNRNASTSDIAPPPKRIKRSHTLSSVASSVSASSAVSRASPLGRTSRTPSVSAGRPAGPTAEHTPPPSPPSSHQHAKLDIEGVNDDIVVAVLKQLEKTGNRPHLIKELVAVLINTLSVVESSANPAAIISSRLSNYLKRPWTALAPCPLGKEQTKTHPRSVYYFLTTCPMQELPDFAAMAAMIKRVTSPAISSDPADEEDIESRKRRRDSMSPEVDLILPDIDLANHHTIGNIPFLDSDFILEDRPAIDEHINIAHNRRAASPPLEHDEREFTQTASDMQQRKQSEQAEIQQQQPITMPSPSESIPGFELTIDQSAALAEEESEERAAVNNRNAANALFGQSHQLLHIGDDAFGAGSSPMLRPLAHPGLHVITTSKKDLIKSADLDFDLENDGGWGELKSAESVELSELDDLLGGY